ncbi:MAG: TlpA disulfide reductase family protein [Candidatus Erginobacter occultus]|nr:TlpA disulfide reductase family protein [Candidatus Erginobacter occultus]
MNLLLRNTAPLLAALALALVPAGCGGSAKEQTSFSGKAPHFELENFSGGRVRLSDYRGKVVLLNFWATWCPPCVTETPDFVNLYKNYRERGLVILGVSLDQNPRAVLQPFIRKHKIEYPILLADRRVTNDYGGITSIPTTFLIDREGIIREQYVGYQPKSVVEKAIKQLL